MTAQRPWTKFYPEGAEENAQKPIPYAHLGELATLGARDYGNQIAFTVCLPNGAAADITYGELDKLSDDFAVYLREELGLKKGDVVAIQSPNCLAYPIVVFGTMKAGCIVSNTNPLYTEPEMVHQFNDSGAKVLCVIDMFGDKVDKVINQTKVERVITLSLVDFMPMLKKLLIGAVLKYVRKQIPTMTTPHTKFADTLAAGSRIRSARSIDVRSYSADIQLDDDAIYQYTGGTTGVSKGAALTHRNILSNVACVQPMFGEHILPGKETIMTALPLYHIFAFTVNMCIFMTAGARNVLVPSPRPLENLIPVFENYDITWMTGVNTLFAGLLNADWFMNKKPKIKVAGSGGTALQSSVADKWEQTIGTIVEGYGLTESSPIVSFNPLDGNARKGSIGVPLPGVDVKLVDDDGNEVPVGERGELLAKGPNIMRGYLNRPDATAETLRDGWLYTGDIAVMHEDGFFEIVDRKKDMILVSGFNVYPNDLEDAISKLPGVAEVAVIGVPDEKSGEAPKAFIVKGDPSLTADAVIDHCKQNLTGYKVPRQIEFREDLPKTPVGKILRKNLKAEEAAKRGG